MFVFKLFSFSNIVFYITIFILILFILFLAYKYIYLEQSVYLLTNKLNRMEIEYNNPSTVQYNNSINESIRVADNIMNEIFTDTSNICDEISGFCEIPKKPKVEIVEPPVEIFDLKKEVEVESVVSASVDTTSKNLMKLNIEKLKTKCEERELPTDGTKKQLVERIINYDNSKNEELLDVE